jgi:hypothetical protein
MLDEGEIGKPVSISEGDPSVFKIAGIAAMPDHTQCINLLETHPSVNPGHKRGRVL